MDIKEEMKMQIAQLNMWTKAYDEGHPIVSDKEWDRAYFDLAEFERKTGIVMPNSPTQKIHYEVVSALKKVEHNHPMLSLDKTKDWDEFLQYFSGKDVIGMLKLDGLTCSLRYVDGNLVSAETRGNGIIGEDILHNARVMPSIPKKINYTDELIVDGEVICKNEDFKEFSNEYANSRNFASGSIRLLDSKECSKRKLSFVVWNIVKGFENTNSFLDKLYEIQSYGFEVVPWVSSFDWDAKEFLIDQAKIYGYPYDGLVGRFDDIKYGESLGTTGHHSRAAYAFKFYDEEYDTRLRTIEWTMGRTGILTPVAIFDSIDTGDSTIERASLHNYSIMRDTLGDCAYVGEPLKIFKANMIIPQVSAVADEFKKNYGEVITAGGVSAHDTIEFCPVCYGEVDLVKSDSGVLNYVCMNPQCEGKLINRLDHFCSKRGLDIKGLSKATLEKLIGWGWVSSIDDIYALHNFKTEWMNKPGFGEKSVENILTAINNSRNCELYSFICAIGIPLIGSTYAKQLAKKISTWEDFLYKVEMNEDFTKYDGFGPEMNEAIHKFNYIEAKLVYSMMRNVTNSLYGESSGSNSLNGINVVITGKLNIYKNRAALQEAIEHAGGKVFGSVSKNTTYLINNDNTSTSSKNVAANKLGIPVLTEEEFIKKFLEN